jgi:aryl-alcohol dehydrogenase-like predicted oxidoreductase
VNAIVGEALDRGVNFFDTAEMYNDGASEAALGKALKGRRAEAVICSKVSPSNAGKIRERLTASLARLGTGYLDVYMLHWPVNPLALRHFSSDRELLKNPPSAVSAYRAMEDLKKEGLVRCIGMSNFGVRQMTEIMEAGVRIDLNEMPYNIASRAIEAEIAPFCMENGIAIVGSMALQQGILAGLYRDAAGTPPPQAHSRHFSRERGGSFSRHTEPGAEEELFALVRGLEGIAAEAGLSPAALAIAWVLGKPFVASTLAGSRNSEELRLNIEACGVSLDGAVMEKIDKISLPLWKKLGDSPDYYEDRDKSRIY